MLHSSYTYLLGTIDFCKENLPKLSFLGKLTFLAKWLKQSALPLTQAEKEQLENEHSVIDDMLKEWHYLLPRLDIQKHSRKLEEFRLQLEKELIQSLQSIPSSSEKISLAKRLLKTISVGGVYKPNGDCVTVPDPQLVTKVKNIILDLREEKLNALNEQFTNYGVRTQKAVLRLLAGKRIPSIQFLRLPISIIKKWVSGAKRQLSHIPNESNITAKFLDSLMEGHQQKISQFYVQAPRKALYTRWSTHVPSTPLRSSEESSREFSRRLFL